MEIFNNRELAAIIWVSLLLTLATVYKKSELDLISVIKSFLAVKVFSIFLLSALYAAPFIYVLSHFTESNVIVIKEGIYWLFGTCLAFLLKTPNIQSVKDLKSLVFENFKLIALIQLFVFSYTFSLPTEIVLFPFIALVVGVSVVAKNTPESAGVAKAMNIILGIFGLTLVLNAASQIIVGFNDFLTLENFTTITMTPLLSLWFLPALYLITLLMKYESLLLVADHVVRHVDKPLRKYLQRQIILFCRLSMAKVVKMHRHVALNLRNLESKHDVDSFVERMNDPKLFAEYND